MIFLCITFNHDINAEWYCLQDVQKAREELERKKNKSSSKENELLRQESCDQNAPVIKCQVGIDFIASFFLLLLFLYSVAHYRTVNCRTTWTRTLFCDVITISMYSPNLFLISNTLIPNIEEQILLSCPHPRPPYPHTFLLKVLGRSY